MYLEKYYLILTHTPTIVGLLFMGFGFRIKDKPSTWTHPTFKWNSNTFGNLKQQHTTPVNKPADPKVLLLGTQQHICSVNFCDSPLYNN